jgi:hypothetical protein
MTKFQVPLLIIDGVADTKKLTQLPCYLFVAELMMFSVTQTIGSNDWITVNNELEGMWKEAAVA